ncbi:uncharacterized protein [Palaemon carinicauda]|uniref:uncharacterized protein n=1 Tax=Palaemon carinicauda TaxID=392227 RepID=UPI0035B5E906
MAEEVACQDSADRQSQRRSSPLQHEPTTARRTNRPPTNPNSPATYHTSLPTNHTASRPTPPPTRPAIPEHSSPAQHPPLKPKPQRPPRPPPKSQQSTPPTLQVHFPKDQHFLLPLSLLLSNPIHFPPLSLLLSNPTEFPPHQQPITHLPL